MRLNLLRFLFFILVVLLNLEFCQSKTNNEYNSFLGFYIGGGYPFVYDNYVETSNMGVFTGNIGLNYGFTLNNLWFELGLEYQHQASVANYNVSGTDITMLDTQGKEMLFHYNFNRAIDKQNFNIVSLPFILGYYNSGFFIGAGPKIGFCINIVETSNLYYTTSATYNQYIEDFVNMPNHYYATYEEISKKNLLPNLRVSIIAETGYDVLVNLNKENYNSLKISVFAECSFVNLKSDNTSLSLYDIDKENPSKIKLLPFYFVKATNSNRVTPFYSVNIGVKLSWLINFPYKECKNCPHRWNKSRFLR